MHRATIGGAWWETLNTPRPRVLALLVLAGILIEAMVHLRLGIAVVYTHYFYLVIVISGLWYGRRAILIAISLGIIHIADAYLLSGAFSPDPFIRTGMFAAVALIVGMTKEQSDAFRDQLVIRNRELEDMNIRLAASEDSFGMANKKLNLLSSITRHDIKNQIVALLGFLGLAGTLTTDPRLAGYIGRAETAALAIQRQIEFTKSYEEIGIRAPQWHDVHNLCIAMQALVAPEGIAVSISAGGLEVYADPLLEKVFENLVDNSLRHGQRVRNISFSTMPYGLDIVAIVYEDDGVGIHERDKERVFEKGYGSNTGLGLFLTREILSITGIMIKESGEYGKGVRFEILVPKGKYRIVSAAHRNEP